MMTYAGNGQITCAFIVKADVFVHEIDGLLSQWREMIIFEYIGQVCSTVLNFSFYFLSIYD